MKKPVGFSLIFALFSLVACQTAPQQVRLENAAQTLQMHLELSAEGQPFYRLFYQDQLVLDTSFLGLVLENLDLSHTLRIGGVEGPVVVSDTYELQHGKQRQINYSAQAYTVTFQNDTGAILDLIIQLSEQGMAYRFRLNSAPGERVLIQEEVSTFGFPAGTKAWMQPLSKAKSGWRETNPSYEEHYRMGIPVDEASPIGEGYVFPALFAVGESWLLLSETDLHRNYCGSHLQYDSSRQALKLAFPQPAEVFPNGELLPNGPLPFSSPWRTIAVGALQDIVQSTLGTDLAAPAIEMDTDFIHSGLASWSWVLLKDDFTNYETSHAFIDYASEMEWPYCLIDADWDWKIGYERMQELVDYARSKEVKILLWYNSSGDWNSTTYTPKSKLVDPAARRAEFARLQKMGVAGCKVDFFGGDGQSMIAYYHDILQDAADHQLLLNFHGATLPRGWHRTYPNLMTVEAIKGQEFITFEQVNADLQPAHCAVIPFTRNVYDPMDFTPMVLDSIPNIRRRTTTAFELALPILFTSGVQHIAEIPEGMRKMPQPVVELLKSIPTQWDESRFLEGYPGKFICLARRKGDTWYIVGINGETSDRTFDLDLSFTGNAAGTLFFDGDSDLPANRRLEMGPVQIAVQPHGGFLIKSAHSDK